MGSEEIQYYPKLSTKTKLGSKWSDAFDNEDVFGDEQFDGFMGLEVYHGLLLHICLRHRFLGGVEQGK